MTPPTATRDAIFASCEDEEPDERADDEGWVESSGRLARRGSEAQSLKRLGHTSLVNRVVVVTVVVVVVAEVEAAMALMRPIGVGAEPAVKAWQLPPESCKKSFSSNSQSSSSDRQSSSSLSIERWATIY